MARIRCAGSRTTSYQDVGGDQPGEGPGSWKSKGKRGICASCGKIVGLDPKGSRALYPLEWVLKTHYRSD